MNLIDAELKPKPQHTESAPIPRGTVWGIISMAVTLGIAWYYSKQFGDMFADESTLTLIGAQLITDKFLTCMLVAAAASVVGCFSDHSIGFLVGAGAAAAAAVSLPKYWVDPASVALILGSAYFRRESTSNFGFGLCCAGAIIIFMASAMGFI